MAELKKVDIFCDGACSGNPGPGGWAAILRYGKYEKAVSGGEKQTTNNRMELTALIKALQLLRESCSVKVYTDSQYVINGISKGWAIGWKRRGWKKSDNTPALNPELWDELLTELERHEYSFEWIKGHAGHPENERCDSMAVAESKKFF